MEMNETLLEIEAAKAQVQLMLLISQKHAILQRQRYVTSLRRFIVSAMQQSTARVFSWRLTLCLSQVKTTPVPCEGLITRQEKEEDKCSSSYSSRQHTR